MTKFVGLDLGFRAIKCQVYGYPPIVIPAMLGTGKTSAGKLGAGLKAKRVQKPLHVDLNGASWLVGHNVHMYSKATGQVDMHKFTAGPELPVLFSAAVASALGPGEFEANIMVGLPVEIVADSAWVRRVEKYLREWMVGNHDIVVNKKRTILRVKQIDTRAQPVGTLFGRPASKGVTAIIDCGYFTLDTFVHTGDAIDLSATTGRDLGVHRVAIALQRLVREKYNFEPTQDVAERLLRNPELSNGENIADLVQQALAITWADVINFLRGQLGNGYQFGELVCTGGGVILYRKWLEEAFPQAVWPKDPVTASVEGLALAASLKWR